MLTNIRQSKGRLEKEAEISTYAGRYYLDTPGNGVKLPYFEDPHIRIQKSSGIRGYRGTTDWESELRGITRPLTKYDVHDPFKSPLPRMSEVNSVDHPISDETRTTAPAWVLREYQQDRWETPFLNPLDKAIVPFEINVPIRRWELEQNKLHTIKR
jgi:hypothetical protein